MPDQPQPDVPIRQSQWWPRILEVAGVISGFYLTALPVPDEIQNYPKYVIVTALVLAWIAVRFIPTSQSWWLFLASIAAGFVLGAVFFANSPHWIITSAGQRYFRGVPTDKAAKDMRDKGVTEQQYFFGSGRKPELVYTSASLADSREIVVYWYSAAIFLGSFGIIGALERIALGTPAES